MIIVTGASRGLGYAICQRLIEKGCNVFGIARNVSTLNFPAEQCDVAHYEQIEHIAKKLKKEKAEVCGLINAAGIASMNLALTTPAEVSRRIIETNLLGTIYSCQHFSPFMIRRKAGKIINFSTIAVALALKGESIYVASKAGVEAFSRVFAREMAPFNITVNCIAPGPINTDLLKNITQNQLQKIVSQQIIDKQFTIDAICDVVEIILDDRASSLSGQIFHVGGV